MVYDNGDEFIHYDVDEIEMLSLTENYKANGFLNKVEEANHE
jgi:aryl carrier-like protein